MQPVHIILLIGGYFSLLLAISYITNKGGSNADFFKAGKQSPWYLVAFGMIGASLSGVTFISVPGAVQANSFGYFQVVLGYTLGYATIGLVLLPLYYRLNLTSIYTYLDTRFGNASYKTGASFFLLSRITGASFRLYLVAIVLQDLVFTAMGVPFWLTVTITILLIWLYTFKSGIKTIVWTDTLQTLFMLIAVGVAIYYIADGLGIGDQGVINYIAQSDLSRIFFFEDYKSGNYFFKQFISGIFIAIVMTGLDQDMMQKNLTCRNLKDAQKNMFTFSSILIFVDLLFLSLGALLYIYSNQFGVIIPDNPDMLFPNIAINAGLPAFVGILFIIGIIAAAYSSADSALTSLTTSFCVDIIEFDKQDPKTQIKTRKHVHLLMSFVLFTVILIFNAINDDSVIKSLFTVAGYTYGPLLGMYVFGLFTTFNVKDKFVPIVAILSPVICYIANLYISFGFELLILNGLITFIGLDLIRKEKYNW